MKDKIRSAYSEREPVNNPVSGQPSRTKQEFVNEVNINEIVSRMKRGISPPPWMTAATPRYGDFSNIPSSFQEAYAIVESAEAAFKSLPLEFRRAIDHDPRNIPNAPRELYEQFGLLQGKNPAGASPESDKTPGGTPQASPAPQGAAKTKNKGVNSTPENADE